MHSFGQLFQGIDLLDPCNLLRQFGPLAGHCLFQGLFGLFLLPPFALVDRIENRGSGGFGHPKIFKQANPGQAIAQSDSKIFLSETKSFENGNQKSNKFGVCAHVIFAQQVRVELIKGTPSSLLGAFVTEMFPHVEPLDGLGQGIGAGRNHSGKGGSDFWT